MIDNLHEIKPHLSLLEESKGGIEVISRRRANAKTYDIGGGQFVVVVNEGLVHYQKDGKWEDIDLTIVEKDGKAIMEKSQYKIEIFRDRVGYRAQYEDGWYEMELVEVGDKPIDNTRFKHHFEGNQLFWDDVADGIDIKIQLRSHRPEVFTQISHAKSAKRLLWKITESKEYNYLSVGGDLKQDSLEIKVTKTPKQGNTFFYEEVWTGKVSRIIDKTTRIKSWKENPKFPTVVAVEPQFPVTIDPTITKTIAANNSDGYENKPTSGAAAWHSSKVKMGAHSGATTHFYNGGFRFTSVGIPAGQTITSATLKIKVKNVGTPAPMKVYGDKVSNAAAWATASRPSQITKTTASTAWTPTKNALNSVAVKTQVQSIVNVAGWASGNAMRFGILNSTHNIRKTAQAYDHNTSVANAAKLVIVYSAPHSTKTFTVDGIIYATNTKTFTVDGIMKATSTKTFTIDAIIANSPPSAPTLSSPSNNTVGIINTPTLQWSDTDPDSDAIRYDVQIYTPNWYDLAWTYRVPITIAHGKVPSDQTGFPVYVNLADLPSGFFSNVLSTGADIRVTKSDGVTEVPFELVNIDTVGKTGELHFKGDLSASVDTVFYIYYGNASASAYAANATFGSQNVWDSNFVGVWHMGQNPGGSAPQMKDSTANGLDFTTNGSMASGDSVAAQLGNGINFSANSKYLTHSDGGSSDPSRLGGATAFTISSWVKPSSIPSQEMFLLNKNLYASSLGWVFEVLGASSGVLNIKINSVNQFASASSLVAGTKYLVSGVLSGGNTVILYINGAADKTYTGLSLSVSADTAQPLSLATASDSLGGTFGFPGWVDEVRLSKIARSADWHTTEYNNQNSTSTFYTVGSQGTVTLLEKISGTDTGFSDVTNSGDSDPFPSGDTISFTVQSADALLNSTTYYWKVRGKDPNGSNTYGAWSTTWNFTTFGLKTFTVDGIIFATNTKTFTVDGLMLVHNTYTFTIDGIIVNPAITFTIDGIILATTTKTFTIDGIMKVTTLETFTVDGVVLVQGNTKTFTIDGVVLATTAKTFTIDGVVLVQGNTKTFTVDGIILVTTTKTFTIDGIILVTTPKTFTIDGVVLATTTHTFTIDGIIDVEGNLKTFTIDGIMLVTTSKTFTIDGIVLATTTKTFTVDGVILVTTAKTFTIDGVVLVTTLKTFTIDGIILVTTLETFTVDGIIFATNLHTFTIDGIVLVTTTKTFTVDGIMLFTTTKTFTIDGIVDTEGVTKTFTIDGVVLATTTKTFTVDGIVDTEGVKATFTIDGIMLVTTTKTFTIDGIVLVTTPHTFTIDGIILATTTYTFTVDGIVFATNTASFTIDGIIKIPTIYKTFTVDGIVDVEGNAYTFTIDGVVLATTTKTFTVDGVIDVEGNLKTFTIDGVILVQNNLKIFTIDGIVDTEGVAKTFTIDGVVFATNTKSFTTDGVVLVTTAKLFTIDGIIDVEGNRAIFTVDGIMLVTTLASFTVDAILVKGNYSPPGGRVEESDWLGHGTGGLWRKQEAPHNLYSQVSPIHDSDEIPRLVNKELERLDMFEQ